MMSLLRNETIKQPGRSIEFREPFFLLGQRKILLFYRFFLFTYCVSQEV